MLLGIDIGTSACKVAVFDYDGNIKAEATEKYSVYYPHDGWAEQNPEEWYQAVCVALKRMAETVDLGKITAVGVDGQSWSCIPVSEDGDVLHNTPIWYDTRSKKQCDELKEKIGFERIFNLCKNPVEPCYTTPKVLWFKENIPDVYDRTFKFLQCNSYIVYRLTGVFSQDKSQGYGHFFYDMEKCCYNNAMAEEMGIDVEKFPEIYDCHEVVGTITKKAGGLDAACGTLGAGVVSAGQTQEQGGQAGGMSICTDAPFSDEKLILSNHVVPSLWLLQGGTVAGGAAMEWFAGEFGNSFSKDNMFRQIDIEAEKIDASSDGMIFLPYLNGERSPIWDTNAKGLYYGISFAKTKAHFARATMEGVAYALRHNLETARDAGAKFDTLYSMGGSAKSDVWMQIKADVTSCHMVVPNSDNASTLGAVILAGVGTGVYESFEDAVKRIVKIQKEYFPNKENAEKYNKAFDKYIKIYRLLKEVMAE